MITTRKAKASDLDVVYKLICELEDNMLDYEQFAKTFSLNLLNFEIIYLIAEYNNTTAGFLSIHIQHILHHNMPTCELQELYVFEKYRSIGIGKKLMEEAHTIAQNLHLEEIELTTKLFRKRAQKFYERLGYTNTHLKYVKRLKE